MNRGGLILLSLLASLGDWAETNAATLSIRAEHGAVVLAPPGGSYAAGTEVRLIPRPDTGYSFAGWSGAAQDKRLSVKLTMNSDKNIVANFSPWTPPIGVPTPDFGIWDTYRGYDVGGTTAANGTHLEYPRNPDLTYQASAEGGYFTHYVDNTDPNATNTSNPYGSIAKPRATIPRGLPAGSVVEVHGGPYTADPMINGMGTQTQPIFIRGPSTGVQPQIVARTTIGYYTSQDATYLVLENMHLSGVSVKAMRNTHHISIRACDIEGKITDTHMSGVGVSAASDSATDAQISQVVIYNNLIHNFGDWQATGDPDAHGMSVTTSNTLSPLTTRSSTYVWILDNLFYHNSGNGVQVNAGNLAFQNDVHHIYLGRNMAYENKQDALWTKNATDVIFSQNSIWDHTPSDSSLGGGMGSQYGPDRVWFLFNEISDCSYGIRQSTDDGGGGRGPGTDNYLIGNLIHDIHRPAGEAGGADVWKKGAAIFIASETTVKNIFANTIYHTDSGIQVARRAELHINGNIFANVAEQHVFFEFPDSLGEGASDIAGNLFDVPARILWGRTGDSTVYNLATFGVAHPGKADGSVEADPLFVDAVNSDFHLQPTSPAIDMGVSADLSQACEKFSTYYGLDIAKDITGIARPQGSTWDRGAYEYFLSPIVNLAVSGTSQNSLTLLWTVPGEPGISGTPAGYDIRYASSAITEENWGAATQVQGEPSAGAFGQQQSFTITGLNPGAVYHVAIKVLDPAGHASALSNVVTATTATTGNHAPVLTPIADRSVNEMETLSFAIGATDADGDSLTYAAANLPAGATFTAATRTFTWTPGQGQSGTYYVTFQVTDSHVSISQTIAVVVRKEVNHAPVLGVIGNQAVNENTLLAFSVSAADEDGDTLRYSATGLPSGASFVDRAFRWTPDYGQAGVYPVTFTVSDGELTDSEQITITVAGVTDKTAPVAHDLSPAADAIQIPPNTLIALALADEGSGVDADTVTIQVNNQLVYAGNSALYQSAYGTCRRTGTPARYRYYYQPAQAFDFDQPVAVAVTASDAAHNVMTPLTYQFVTEMRSFGRNQPVSSGSGTDGHPALATDGQGHLWASWHAGPAGARDIYVARRARQRQEWDTPLRLTNVGSDRCNPALALGPDNTLYLAWQDNRRGNWDIYASVSADGATWSDPVRVTDSNDNQTNPVLAVDQASPYRVYIAWERGNPGSRDIYLASCDASFAGKTITQVTSNPADQAEPALAVGSDNTVYLLWTDWRNGSADIYGSSSAVSSWSNVAVVTGPGNQSRPAMAAAPGASALHFVWQSDASGNLDIVYGTSNGLPDSALAGTSLIDDTSGADQFAPSIVAARDHANKVHVYACWQDNRMVGGTSDSDVYVTEIRPGAGRTNVLVGDDGTNSPQSEPALGCDEYGQPVAIWTDSRGSVPRIYSASSIYMKPEALAAGLIACATGGRVGADPAAINAPGDVSIQIPAHACDCDVTVSISEIQNSPPFAALCVAGYEIGPSGVQLASPATVTIPYTASATGRTTPYWYDTLTASLSQQGMTEITFRTLANGIRVVSFKTTHLTPFYILESPIAAGSSGGGCALAFAPRGDIAGFIFPYVALALLLLATRWRDRRRPRGC